MNEPERRRLTALRSADEWQRRRQYVVLPEAAGGFLRVAGDRRRQVEDPGAAVAGVERGPARVADGREPGPGPKTVTRSGSPPKAAMLSRTQAKRACSLTVDGTGMSRAGSRIVPSGAVTIRRTTRR
ncbi:MAG TPA: hypothetical protein VGM12_13210 [Trebonia sp.]